jgi:sterol carrier protein 2
MSNKRQVPGAQVGLQQNFGIGGAAVVTLYKKYNCDRRSVLAKL